MKEYKVFIWIGVFMIFVVCGLVWLAGQNEDVDMESTKKLNEEGITLFYGDGCPHCEDVERFNEENDIKNKVIFEELEVWKDKENAKLMNDAAKICELNLEKIGVPFLFADGKCYVGSPEVQNFFGEKARS